MQLRKQVWKWSSHWLYFCISPANSLCRLGACFSCSGRRIEPSTLWPIQWSLALSAYSQLCAASDGWRWREESPGWAADIRVSSRDAAQRGVEGPLSSFILNLLALPLLLYIFCPYVSLLRLITILPTSSPFLSLSDCTGVSRSTNLNVFFNKNFKYSL